MIMKKSILFLSSLLLGLIPAGAATFNKAIGGTGSDEGRAVITTSDGGLLFVGNTPTVNNGDIVVVKTSVSGTIAWQKNYGTSTGTETAFYVTELNSGNFIIGGMITVSGEADALLINITSSGSLVSMKKYGLAGEIESVTGLCATSDGGYAATSHRDDMSTYGDIVLFKFDASDALSWQTVYTAPGTQTETGSGIQQTSDGGYIICGSTTYVSPTNQLLLKLSSTGSVSWSMAFGFTGASYATGVKQTSDGGYAMVGRTNSGAASVLKTTSSGTLSWGKTYSTGYGLCIDEDGSGNLLFGSSSHEATSISSTGSVNWSSQASGYNNYGLTIASDGEIAVCGMTNNFGNGSNDIHFFKIDGSGSNCESVITAITATSLSVSPQYSGFISAGSCSYSFSSVSGSESTYSQSEVARCLCPANAGPDVSNIKKPCCVPTCLGVQIGTASSGYTYSWSPTSTLSNPSIAQPIASPCSATTYTLTVSRGDCTTNTDEVTVTQVIQGCCTRREIHPDGTSGDELSWFDIYPSPGNGVFTINFNEDVKEVKEVTVTDMQGRIVEQRNNPQTHTLQFDLSNQPAGLYLVSVKFDDKVISQKITIE